MKNYLRLLRVKQWIKNTFLFIPSFFAGELLNFESLQLLVTGFFCFCMVASSVYIINDYRDREVDRLHPKKKNRPIASGAVRESTALVIMFLMLALGITGAAWLDIYYLVLLLTYLALNVGYSFGLKNIPILDLFIVASGFLIRIYSGGILADIAISHWLSIMILLLALFLVLAKRRDDLFIKTEDGQTIRKTSSTYNLEFINSCLTIFSAVIVVSYIMYTVSPEITRKFNSEYLFITAIFVMAGIMRYLQITFVEQNSGSPTTVLMTDKFIMFTVLGWIISFYLIIYVS